MNTPPSSHLPVFKLPSSNYTRAPKRPYLEQMISPPRLRAFEELEDAYSTDFEIERERIKRLEREKELKKEISRQVRKSGTEDWALRGSGGFDGVHFHL